MGFKPDIGEEVLKGMQPALANLNSSPSVPFVVRSLFLGAANDDVSPDCIFRRLFPSWSAVAMAMDCVAFFCHLSLEASTTFLVAINQARTDDDSLFSAVTQTVIEMLPVFGNAFKMKNDIPVKPLAGLK